VVGAYPGRRVFWVSHLAMGIREKKGDLVNRDVFGVVGLC
jgi:hypothetical protein